MTVGWTCGVPPGACMPSARSVQHSLRPLSRCSASGRDKSTCQHKSQRRSPPSIPSVVLAWYTQHFTKSPNQVFVATTCLSYMGRTSDVTVTISETQGPKVPVLWLSCGCADRGSAQQDADCAHRTRSHVASSDLCFFPAQRVLGIIPVSVKSTQI